MDDTGSLRAIWLDAPPGLTAPNPRDALELCAGGPVAEGEDLATILTGRAIVVTAHVPLRAPLLRRCRWVRGIVGIGPGAPVDWEEASLMCLLTAKVGLESSPPLMASRVREAVTAMAIRLRILDDLADGWEGT